MIEERMGDARTPLILRHMLVCLGFLAASWLFYAPPQGWWHNAYFGDGQDSVAFMWFLTWWPFALAQHLPLFHTVYADWPAGTDLAWKTSIPALGFLAAPFTRPFGALPVFNLLMIASPALAGWGVYLAAMALTGEFFAALAAGVLFMISGYEIGQNLGHLNLSFTVALPLCVWAVVAAARQGWSTPRLAVVLGLLLAFEFGVSQEVFTSAMLFAALTLAALWRLHPAARPVLRQLAPGIALGLVLCLALVAPFLWQMLRGWGAARGSMSSPAVYANDLLSSLVPTPLSLLGGRFFEPVSKGFLGNFAEEGGYYSLPLLALLAVAVWRGTAASRVCGVVFLAAFIEAMRPILLVHGVPRIYTFWYPFAHLPLLAALLPCRLSLYGWLAASFIVALWLKPGGWRRGVAVLLCLAVLAPAQSAARNWRAFTAPPVFASLPQGAHVMVLPLFAREMGWQMLSGMRFKLVGQGYLGTGRPAPFRDWALYEPLWENDFTAIDPAGFAAYLAHFDVQDVVVLDSGYEFYSPGIDERRAAAQARALLAAAGWRSADGTLFTPAATLSPAALAQAQARQTYDAAALLRHAHALRRERTNICVLRHYAARWHIPPRMLERVYAGFTTMPLPARGITCPR